MSFFLPKHMEIYRVQLPGYPYGDSRNGYLQIPVRRLKILFSNGEGWEHVSVSTPDRVPNYEELCWVKEQFWDNDQCVMQLHVPKEDHVNCHPNCLHLWRPTDQEIPRPPAIFVGPLK